MTWMVTCKTVSTKFKFVWDEYGYELWYWTHWPLGDLKKNLRKIVLKLILVTDGCDVSSEIALRWTSLDLSDDKSTLVQVMAWCRQATSHYLYQSWPRSLAPYGVTRPQWVNPLSWVVQIIPGKTSHYFKQCHDNPVQWHIYVFLDHDELVVMVTEGDDINFRCGHVVWAAGVIDDIAMTAARGQETVKEWY